MNRRTLLAGSTATLAAGPAREAPAHPDARLIGLCARFDALELIIRDAILVADRQGDDDGIYDPGDVARDEQDELLDVMCSIRPATVDGCAALALVKLANLSALHKCIAKP